MNVYKLLVLGLVLGASLCQGVELDPLTADHASVASLIQKKCIRVETDGSSGVSIDMAGSLLGRPDMLEAIQRAYEEMLPEGESVEFAVKRESAGIYSYVNRHNQSTRIIEVARVVVPQERVLVALYSEGRRFFGEYQSLVQVEVTPESDGVRYNVCVYAYPESRMMRLFAKLPGVERFFRNKTAEMTELTLSVCREIYKKHDPVQLAER